MLPNNYDLIDLQREIDNLQNQLDSLRSYIYFIPQAAPPTAPKEGWVASSDGTGGGFNGSGGAGLYEFISGVWRKL